MFLYVCVHSACSLCYFLTLKKSHDTHQFPLLSPPPLLDLPLYTLSIINARSIPKDFIKESLCVWVCTCVMSWGYHTHSYSIQSMCFPFYKASILGLIGVVQVSVLWPLWSGSQYWGLNLSLCRPLGPFVSPTRANPSMTRSQTGENMWAERLNFYYLVRF